MAIKIDLIGKTAAISGGAGGMGREVAYKLAKAGANVCVADINEKALQSVVKEIETYGVKADYAVVDVTKADEVQVFLDKAEKLGDGKLDIMVAVAGICYDVGPIIDVPEEEIRKLMDINFMGVNHCCQIAGRKMIPHKAGKIVTFSSIAARNGSDAFGHYAASKAAVVNLTQGLSRGLAPYHINVNSVAPGEVMTNMTKNIISQYVEAGYGDEQTVTDMLVAGIPFKEFQQPEEIADAVLFFCSSLSDQITGQTLNVSGGEVIS